MSAVIRAAGGFTFGAAAWCTAGRLALTTDGSSDVLALALPLWALPLCMLAGAAIALRFRALPALALFLPGMLIPPWLGADLPGFLLWQGALSAIIWISSAISMVASLRLPARKFDWPFAAALAAGAVVVGTMLAGDPARVSGDEPHYLVAAGSLIEDGDLDVANDYNESRYSRYYAGSLEPRHAVLVKSGREYPFHGLGVTFVVLPGFAIGGVLGARLLLAAIAAAGVGLLWLAIRTGAGSPAAAWAGALALLLQVPFTAQAAAIYPDGPAAAISAAAMLLLVRLEDGHGVSPGALTAVGGALSILPWLHVRLAGAAIVLAAGMVLLLMRGPHRAARIAALLAIPVIAAAAWLMSFAVMFETIDPTRPFRDQAGGSIAALPAGGFGLLFDLEYGLLIYAPAMAFALVSVRAARRRLPVTTWTAAALVLSSWAIAACFVWYGGTSTPARFLTPVLPGAALLIGLWWTGARAGQRAAFVATCIVGAVLLGIGAQAESGGRLAGDPDGGLTIFDWANDLVALEAALPSLFRDKSTLASEILIAALWTLPLAGAYAICRRSGRGAARHGSVVAGAAVSLVLAISVGASLAWTARDAQARTPDRSQAALLRTADSRGWLSSGIVHGTFVEREQVLSRIAFAAPGVEPRTLLRIADVPAGRYSIDASTAAPGESLSLEVGRDAWPLATWAPAVDGRAGLELALVTPVHSIAVRSSVPAPVSRVRLRRLAGFPQALREPALRVTRYGQWLVYSLDRWSYVETGGLWIAGDRTSSIVVADVEGRSAGFELQLEAGPSPVRLEATRAAWTAEIDLAPGERRRLGVPQSDGPAPVALTVAGGFRAATAFGTRGDGRWLGVWLSLAEASGSP